MQNALKHKEAFLKKIFIKKHASSVNYKSNPVLGAENTMVNLELLF